MLIHNILSHLCISNKGSVCILEEVAFFVNTVNTEVLLFEEKQLEGYGMQRKGRGCG